MTLPAEIRSFRTLIERSPEHIKGRVLETVRRYSVDDPPRQAQYNKKGQSIRRYRPHHWPYLYIRTLSDCCAVFVYVNGGNIWAYRGRWYMDTDMFGPKALVIEDELRLMRPIFSRFDVDNYNRNGENLSIG